MRPVEIDTEHKEGEEGKGGERLRWEGRDSSERKCTSKMGKKYH